MMMKRTMSWAAAAVMALGLLPGPAWATIEIQKQAKGAAAEAPNCMACHAVKMPKKGAADLNDKGKWLVAQKTEKKAAKIDGAWLKDYKK
jgi:mono/diheme cytochrome c family protein